MDRQKVQLELEYGHISWWGFSPAVDLVKSEDVSPNVLLIGASDPRHIIALSSQNTSPSFYISESNIVLYARHILLLSILFEKNDAATNYFKCKRFLLIYGNSLIDEETGIFLRERCKELSESVIKSRNMAHNHPDYSKIFLREEVILDLSRLKYREIDALEMVFKNWSTVAAKKNNKMISFWDLRNRSLLGIRHGSRDGVYDLDYEMRFKETVLGITSKEYKKWRLNGIAFNCGYEEMDDQKLVDNVTLVSPNIIKNRVGNKVAIEGYWGDVVSGSPFIPFGINSEMKISLEDSKLKSMGSDSSISYLTKLLGNSKSHLLSKVKGYSDHLIVESLIGLISLSKGIHIGFQDKIKTLFSDSSYHIKTFNPLKDFYLHLETL
ncbi:dynein axonemal assembly factor 3 isoform X2 [Lepeophtheirus salmonis]|uniref:dynein axonemal assembly factor 3 isoform X2 n=1 Tax=Lepeophtheirus salmonis TaxID=72036 RepID=UPI003AF33C25